MSENEHRKVIAMIASIDVESKHRKFQSLRFHGTGEWLLQNDNYLEWKHASSSSSLCCYGIRKYGLTWLITHGKAALTTWVHQLGLAKAC